ncbi:MAG TPA: flagellar hook-basal body complex protein FliE [Candidatus Eremiobacteraceae bacterium]|nr:flagellar hook-basal body complex protein FliE [Candidatus Eremiobacteraceae bacterium]
MNVDIIDGVAQAGMPASASPRATSSFGDALASALGGAADALHGADVEAAVLAGGGGDVAGASIARAKADVALEVISVAASRVSSAVNSLLQTQV